MIFSSIYALICLKNNKDNYVDIGLGWIMMSTIETVYCLLLFLVLSN